MAVTAKTGGAAPVPEQAIAEEAGLRYVRDDTPGWSRRKLGDRWFYYDTRGRRMREERQVRRIDALAIPPAWTEVWICPHAQGHIQATGRDAKGRKQYRYHPDYRALRDKDKFCRLVEFGEALPQIRRHARGALKKRRLSRGKVLAVTLCLLEGTGIRVGNEEYARQNGSFGLTTLTKRHVEIRGELMRFEFKAKSGKTHAVQLRDKRVARVLKQCSNLPGQLLFQYRTSAGEIEQVCSTDVNDLLREITGQEFSAKDYRTWLGTTLATHFFKTAGPQESARARKRVEVATVTQVAALLNNKPSTCRRYYIHPGVLESWLEDRFFDILRRRRNRKKWRGLLADEKDALKLCLHHLERGGVRCD